MQKLIYQSRVNVWKNEQQIQINKEDLVDAILRPELDKVKHKVLKKDMDWVAVFDGEEGVGKSVLAQQIGRYLDDDFTLDNIVFTADDFIRKIKDVNTKKGTAIVLDEAFSAANSRASMSEVNRSLIGVATEMRQKNLFILIVLPSFFDLDRYFALWRCKSLFHLYFDSKENRRYVIFPKTQKKLLYIFGKKTYNYSKPRSPYPPLVFPHLYCVIEENYRQKKSSAFTTRPASNQARRWLQQRDAFIKYIIHNLKKMTLNEIGQIPKIYGAYSLTEVQIGRINRELIEIGEEKGTGVFQTIRPT